MIGMSRTAFTPLQDYDVEHLPMSQQDATARLAQVALKGLAGLPVGVQVSSVSRRFKDSAPPEMKYSTHAS